MAYPTNLYSRITMSVLTARVPISVEFEQICEEIEHRIDAGGLKLPVLPLAVQKVLAMNSDPEFDVDALSKLIHQDHTLAGHVLRVSNSSIYAGAYKTSSLSQAISRLGGHAMVKIAVSITMQGQVFQVVGFKEEITDIWHHSLASGVYAQEIADVCGRPNPEMYMCGLMHQVGKPVLLQALVEISKSKNMTLSHEVVDLVLDRYHTQVGSLLSDNWKLPASVKTSCLHYRTPSACDTSQEAVNITHLASRLADHIMHKDTDAEFMIADDAIMQALGLSDEQITMLLSKKDEIKEMMKAVAV